MSTQEERAARFQALHAGEPFVIPNPWDAGSARVLEGLGFQALATTSSGFAFTLGRRDGRATLDEVAVHVEALVRGDRPARLRRPRERLRRGPRRRRSSGRRSRRGRRVDRGLGSRGRPLRVARGGRARRGRGRGCARPRAGRSRSRLGPRTTFAVTPTSTTRSRACRHSSRREPMSSTRRGSRAPTRSARCARRSSKPVNVLARPTLTLAEIAEAGGRRVSVGGALTWTAISAFVEAATAIRERGDFSSLGDSSDFQTWLS